MAGSNESLSENENVPEGDPKFFPKATCPERSEGSQRIGMKYCVEILRCALDTFLSESIFVSRFARIIYISRQELITFSNKGALYGRLPIK